MKLMPLNKKSSDNKATDKPKQKIRLPFAVKIIYIVAAICVPLYFSFLLSERFSDFFNKYIGSGLRAVLAHLTSWIPFSLAEFFLLLIPIWLILIARTLFKHYGDSLKETLSACLCVLCAVAFVFSTFTIGFASAYRGSTLDKKLGIQRCDVSAEELYSTALILIDNINAEVDNIVYDADGFSVMPYTLPGMNKKLLDAFDTVCDQHSFVQRLDSRIKPVMISKAMSYTHITGVYTFFTGEANINVDFPSYSIPYTAAHELSHQRGIAREDEANFMAYLVCSSSDDSYLRYVANLNLYEYVAYALSQANIELYAKAYAKLPAGVKGELRAYSKFFEKYKDSAASEVSDAINDTFLTIQGTEGTKSYGMVVDLAVAYFKADEK
jgi:hypothetical protein